MWTAKLTDLERRNGTWRISVDYSDGVVVYSRNYSFERITKKQLRDVARQEVTKMVNDATTDIDIPIGTTIDVTPDPVVPPTPPTQAEIDEAAWFSEWDTLRSLILLANHGLLPLTDTRITNRQSNLISTWKNLYLVNI